MCWNKDYYYISSKTVHFRPIINLDYEFDDIDDRIALKFNGYTEVIRENAKEKMSKYIDQLLGMCIQIR